MFKDHKIKFQKLKAFSFTPFTPRLNKLDLKFSNSKFRLRALKKN